MAKNKFTQSEIDKGDNAGRDSSTRSHEDMGQVDTAMTRRGSAPSNLWGKQTIKTGYALDTSDMELPDERGAKMGGSPENVAHSLKGASVVSR